MVYVYHGLLVRQLGGTHLVMADHEYVIKHVVCVLLRGIRFILAVIWRFSSKLRCTPVKGRHMFL